MATYSGYCGGENRATHNLSNEINEAFQLNGSYLMGLTAPRKTITVRRRNHKPAHDVSSGFFSYRSE